MTEHENYAHIRDPQSERTKWELWAIVAIVVVVIAGSIIWRVVTHHPAKPQTDWGRNAWPSHASAPANAPAGAANAAPH
jgi:hypothetical protein